jgi:DNA-binding LacI/PurR family transcriptional regulator
MKIPRKILLVDQVADLLQREIAKGAWQGWLPSGRELSEQLNVNRRTLRLAAHALCERGILETVPRQGIRIVATPAPAAHPVEQPVVGLLIADSHAPRSFNFEGVHAALQELFFQNEIRFSVHHGRQYFRRDPTEPLEHLVERHPSHCWVLRSANARVQQWFADRRLPVVIWGRCQSKVNLPSVSINLTATTRYAVGALLGLGHRRLALFAEQSPSRITRDAFLDSLRSCHHADVHGVAVEHEANPRSIKAALERCVRLHRPTAILVTRTYCYVAVMAHLARMGIRVPQDISVISRDDDPLYEFMLPRPSHFTFTADAFAKQLYTMCEKVIHREMLLHTSVEILPEFVRGESVGPPAAPSAEKQTGG